MRRRRGEGRNGMKWCGLCPACMAVKRKASEERKDTTANYSEKESDAFDKKKQRRGNPKRC